MSEHDEQGGQSAETAQIPPEPSLVVRTIRTLMGEIPQSELRLRGQLTSVLEIFDSPAAGSPGDESAIERIAWRRAVQHFGTRVYELKQQGEELPGWVAMGTAIVEAYVPQERQS